MKEYFRKTLTMILSMVLIITQALITDITAGAEEVTIEQMVADSNYNVALNKEVTVYPGCVEGNTGILVDGVLGDQDAASHVSISQTGFNYYGESYATIDLGAVYSAATIDKIVVQYRYGTVNVGTATVVGKPYSIQYSTDGITFTTVASTDSATLDSDRMTYDDVSGVSGAVRYARLYFPETVQYSMQLLEIAVLDTDGNLAESQVETVEDITDLVVTSPSEGQISVQFHASITENVIYRIFVNDTLALSDAKAGEENILSGYKTGNYTVKVVTENENGFTSAGVSADISVVGPIEPEDVVADADYNLALGTIPTYSSWKEGNNNNAITDGIVGGSGDTGNYEAVYAPGYFQINLDKLYNAEVIDSIVVWYRDKNASLCPSGIGYEIQYSEDGENFITVKTVSAEDMPGLSDNSVYKTEADMAGAAELVSKVQYIRVVYSGTIEWGAQAREIAVFDMSGKAGVSDSEPGKTEYNIFIDETVVATVEEGKEYTLPATATYGYFDGTDMYKAGSTVTVTSDMAFTSVNELSVTMANGAGIRYIGTAGIRFQSTILSDNMDAVDSDAITEGALITANDIYENIGEGTPLTLTSDYTKINVENSGWYNSTVGTYCGSICDVVESNYTREFTARAYVTINYVNADALTVYSDMGPVRTISQIATAVKNAGYAGIDSQYYSVIDSFIK